ncbi:MAG: response regulator [Candidatus Aminicenantes bacterium]|nr:response regulator [Candidatus Aminicenantes bacterium]
MKDKKNSEIDGVQILIAEDSPTQAEQLKYLLEKQNYKVLVAKDGKEALEMVGKHSPSLVISDIVMPEMSGYELCKEIKACKSTMDIPVILLTSLFRSEDVLEAISCGADNFITKPFSEDYLIAHIKQIHANKGIQKNESDSVGVGITFAGKRSFITATRQQILTLLISTYEAAVYKNKELTQTQEKLKLLNENLEDLVEKRTATLSEEIEERILAESQKEIALEALTRSEKNFRRSLDDSPLGVRVAADKGETIYANKMLLDIYGYANVEELNKVPIKERYTPQSYAEFQMRKKDRERGDFGPSEYEINIVRKNGEIRHLLVFRKEILWNGTKQFQVIYQDITDRKQAEEKIRNSLAEKEVLLKEVHHRVKNNLMTLIGLIKMQEAKTDNVAFSDLLRELEGRVRAMAQVHENLHKSKDLARVNLQDYIETMSAHIRAQFGADRDIHFQVQAAGVEVNLDIAIPCGLILNELITNACKHAFPAGQPGEICISFQERTGVKFYAPTEDTGTVPVRGTARRAPTDGENAPAFELTVADNGVGLPADLDFEKSETLGLRLVKMLSQQLNGSIALDRSAGTVFSLKFPVAVP